MLRSEGGEIRLDHFYRSELNSRQEVGDSVSLGLFCQGVLHKMSRFKGNQHFGILLVLVVRNLLCRNVVTVGWVRNLEKMFRKAGYNYFTDVVRCCEVAFVTSADTF